MSGQMIPTTKIFAQWLDSEGELQKNAPEYIKQIYPAWKKEYDEWQKKRFAPSIDDAKLNEYENHFKSNIDSPFELDMIMELIEELRKK